MNELNLYQREPLRGIGACEPDADELESGWICLGGGAHKRVEHVESEEDSASAAEEAG